MEDFDTRLPISDWDSGVDEKQEYSPNLDFDKDRIFTVDQTRVLVYTASGIAYVNENLELEDVVKNGLVVVKIRCAHR